MKDIKVDYKSKDVTYNERIVIGNASVKGDIYSMWWLSLRYSLTELKGVEITEDNVNDEIMKLNSNEIGFIAIHSSYLTTS